MSGFAMKRWQTALAAFFVIAASLLAGCSKATDARLVAADSLMDVRPDSALAILQAIAPESLRGKANNAYYALLLTQAQYKTYVPITSDSLIDVAVRYYDNAGDAEKRTRAYIFKGAALNEMGDHLAAIEWYKKAETVADTGDYENLGYIHMRLGELYKNTFIGSGEDIANYKEALRYYRLAGDTKYQQVCLSMIGGLYRGSSIDSAFLYLREALRISRERNDSNRIFYNMGMLSRAYFIDSQAVRAKDMAVRVIREGRCYLTDNNPYYDAANAYARLGMVDSAKYYFLQRTKRSELLPPEIVSELLTRINMAKALGDYRAAYVYYDSVNSYVDNVTSHSLQQNLFELERRYDKKQLEVENIEMRHRNMIQAIFIVAICITVAGGFVVLHRRKRRQLQEAYILRDKIQREHSDAIKTICEKEAVSAELKHSLEMLLDTIKEVINCSYLYGNKATKFVDKFHQIVELNNPDADFWKHIEYYVNVSFHGLLHRIKEEYPNLREHEVKFISLVACGFSTVEIMVCMNYTNEHTVSNKRLTIVKKMGIDTSLDDFIKKYKI